MEKAKQAGMDDYLTKPYKKDDLYQTIQQLTSLVELPAEQVPIKKLIPF
jgi:CheY-like chemotaxis protein